MFFVTLGLIIAVSHCLLAVDANKKTSGDSFTTTSTSDSKIFSWTSAKVLVIGGTGFMGRHTVQRLLDAGVAVEILTDGRSKNPWGTRVPETVCDRHEPCLGRKLEQGPWDLVVDLPVFSIDDAAGILSSKRWIRHYIFPSSDDVYMVCDRTRFSYGPSGGVLEESAVRPSNISKHSQLDNWDAYGSNKLTLENKLRGSNVNFTAMRLPDVWGPYESSGRFVTFLRALEHGRQIGLNISSGNPVFARQISGETFSPGFVFAKDVAQMVFLLLQAGPQQGPLNVAVAEKPTVTELVNETFRILQQAYPRFPLGKLLFSDQQEVPLLSTDIGPLDIGRAKALGFVPTPWQQGWQETVASLVDISRDDSLAAAELATCRKHCNMVCFCEPTAALSYI